MVADEEIIYGINMIHGKHHTLGGIVSIDPDEIVKTFTTKGFMESPFYITLAHELGHAFLNMNRDNIKGSNDFFSLWYKLDGQKVQKTELFSSRIENAIRSDNNLPLREYYSNIEYDDGSFKPYKKSYLLNNSLYNFSLFRLFNNGDNGGGCNCIDFSNTGRQ